MSDETTPRSQTRVWERAPRNSVSRVGAMKQSFEELRSQTEVWERGWVTRCCRKGQVQFNVPINSSRCCRIPHNSRLNCTARHLEDGGLFCWIFKQRRNRPAG